MGTFVELDIKDAVAVCDEGAKVRDTVESVGEGDGAVCLSALALQPDECACIVQITTFGSQESQRLTQQIRAPSPPFNATYQHLP